MTGRDLAVLLRGAGLSAAGVAPGAIVVDGVTLDSRQVDPGHLFVAVAGARADGADFVPEALRRGAVAIVTTTPRPSDLPQEVAWVQVDDPREVAAKLVRELHGRPDEALRLVGVTGTNGKTTVTWLVEAIARAAGRPCGRIGTTGWSIQGTGAPLDRTTPEAPAIYALLAEMQRRGTDVVAMEVSSHALALRRVAGARFAVAAFLNLGRDHLDFHRDVQAYFEAKAELFAALGPDQVAVLPAADPHGVELASRTRARCLTFGRSAAAQVRLQDEHSGLDGSSAILVTPAGKLPIRTFLAGSFNLDNVAAAAACALALELPAEAIAAGVLALERVPGRLERIDRGQPFTVVVDYAHTEQALERLLGWARRTCQGRVTVVFGCGGERDRGKRGAMGRIAADSTDAFIVTNDNPRGEDPEQIAREVMEGATEAGAARGRIVLDRREAIQAAIAAAERDDLVIIAGKGHEATQTLAGRVEPFDDREEAVRALAELGWVGGTHAHA